MLARNRFGCPSSRNPPGPKRTMIVSALNQQIMGLGDPFSPFAQKKRINSQLCTAFIFFSAWSMPKLAGWASCAVDTVEGCQEPLR